MIKTVFYGGSHYILPILEVLDTVLIVTTEKNLTDPVISYALKNNIPFLSVSSLNEPEIINELKEKVTEVAILADFGVLIPSDILNLYPKGIINIHPSLLPKYRGPTPIQTSLLNGNYETGVTLIKLDNEVDHGPILAQRKLTLTPDDTADSGYLKLFSEGAKLLKENFEKYVSGEITLREQVHNDATFTKKLIRKDGYFDIMNPPAPQILKRMVYAYHPWPSVWTKVHLRGVLPLTPREEQVCILKFLPARNTTQVPANEPEIILQMEGKKPISLKDFYNGYPELKDTIQKVITYNL